MSALHQAFCLDKLVEPRSDVQKLQGNMHTTNKKKHNENLN